MSFEKGLMSYVLVLFGLISCVVSQSKVTTSDDGQAGTIKFSTPDLSDEESHSPWMPSQLKCDACRIIAFQLHDQFSKYNAIHKSRKFDVPESELLEITEQVCDTKTYETIGFIEVDGVHRLKGPGLETKDTPGVMQGGGKWPGRLRDMCDTYMGEIGEVDIYKVYKKNPKSRQQFEDYLCRGSDLRGECKRFEDGEEELPSKTTQKKKKKKVTEEL